MSMSTYIETAKKVFSCSSTNDRSDSKTKLRIESDGTVLAWDPVGNNWTSCHAIDVDTLWDIQAEQTQGMGRYAEICAEATASELELEHAANRYTQMLQVQRALDTAIQVAA